MMTRNIHTLLQRLILAAGMLLIAVPGFANPGKPSFGPNVWGDGKLWGTKGTTTLPAPNEHNLQSFDGLYMITNSNNPAGQAPVSEAAPGNPMYNGGRWIAYTVEWTQAGFDAHGTVPVLTSFADILIHLNLGHLMITEGNANPDGPDTFQCPLLPNKQA